LQIEAKEEGKVIPVIDNAHTVHMPAPILAEAISKTIFAVSNDELRPAMSGVLVQLGDKAVTFVSTDAHKLVRYRRSDIGVEKPASLILPKKALFRVAMDYGVPQFA